MKPTCKKLRELLSDEKQATKEYRSYKFKKLYKDEHSHAKFIHKELKKRCKK